MNNTKIKICLISDSENIFDVRKFYKDAISLTKNGYEVFYITHGLKSYNKVVNNIKISIIGLRKFLPVNPYINFLKFLKALKTKADYYQIYSPYLLPFGYLLKKITKKPIIYSVLEDYMSGVREDENINYFTKYLALIFIYFSELLFLNSANVIIVSDDSIKKAYVKKHNFVETIYNYPRLDLFNPENIDEKLLSYYANDICVIYHGGISIGRGILEATEAISIIAQKIKNIKLLIVGTEPRMILKEMISKICTKYDTKNNIEFINSIDHKEIAKYINICEFGIVPFRNTPKLNKNIPQKIFEYMACKKPFIGSDLPPISKYINESFCGKIVEPQNIKSLAKEIEYLISNSDIRNEMGKNGFYYCIKKYNWDEMEKKYLKIFNYA